MKKSTMTKIEQIEYLPDPPVPPLGRIIKDDNFYEFDVVLLVFVGILLLIGSFLLGKGLA